MSFLELRLCFAVNLTWLLHGATQGIRFSMLKIFFSRVEALGYHNG